MPCPDEDKIRLTFELDPDNARKLMALAAALAVERETSIDLVNISPASSPREIERTWNDSPSGYYREVEDPYQGTLKLITKDKLDAFAVANGIDKPTVTNGIIGTFTPLGITYRPVIEKKDEPAGAFLERQRNDSGIRIEATKPLLKLLGNENNKISGLGPAKRTFIMAYLQKTLESLEEKQK
jgi:hypothetical protein